MKTQSALFFLLCAVLLHAQTPHLVAPIGNIQSVNAVAFSPDGRHVLTGSGEMLIGSGGLAKLWDLQGREIQSYTGHSAEVSAVAFSPDEQQVLTGSPDQTAKLWSLQGRELQTFKGHTFGVNAVAFSPDGKSVLTGSGDKTAKLWDLQGQLLRTFKGHTDGINSVAFSPDGQRILTGSNDFTAKLWDLQGRLLQTFNGNTLEISSVAFSPDGKTILTGSSNDIAKLWNLDGREILSIDTKSFGLQSLAFSPDGQQILSCGKNGSVKLWDLQGRELHLFQHPDWVTAGVFSPDGKTILTGSKDNIGRLWDLNGQELQTFQGHAAKITSVAFSPDGQQLLIGSADNLAKIWDVQRREIKALKGHSDAVQSAAFSPAGQELLTSSNDHTVKLWDLQGRELRTFTGPRFGLNSAAFSPDGQRILTGSDKAAKLWDLQGREIQTLTGRSNFTRIAFSPDGQKLLTEGDSYNMELLDLQGKLLQAFNGHSGPVNAFAFSPDGERVISGSGDNTAKLWNLQGRELQAFKGHIQAVTSVAFSPDGQRVLTGSRDNTAKLWDLQGRELQTFKGHTHWITSVAFSPDGQLVLTGSWDNTAKLWDVKTGKELATLLSVNATDWVVTSPSGLFDASPGAMNLLYFVAGLEVIELDQLKERYFEPGLLTKVMGISKDAVRDVSVFNSVALYPEIEANLQAEQLVISLKARNGGMGKLSFFINGKEVAENLNPDGKTTITVDLKTYDKYYLPGNNTLALRAYNSDNWLKSPAYELAYLPPAAGKGVGDNDNNNKPQPQLLSSAKPHLYVIVIGTSDYSGDLLDLRFPDLDAKAVAQALSSAGKALFADRVHLRLLTTDGKTPADISSKKNIAAAFAECASQAKPTDILIVYFSGHGVTYGGAEKSQFYYLTKDIASPDLKDPDVRNNYTVSSEDLTKWLTDITARKQVMILDACNSGKVVDALAAIGARDLNASQIRALDRMKDRTGMFILTGAAADKVSFEASQYGQGLLTYSLLQGMSGLALTSDKRVDVMTLFQYARDQVPELAKSIHQVQIPVLAFPNGGASFDIGIVDASVKIPLAQVKPVFIRNIFQDENTFDDVLGLTAALAGYFQQITARGAQAELIYVDVSEYENAYSIKGLYSVSDDAVTVRGRLFQGKTSKGEFSVTGKKTALPALVEAIVGKVSGML